MSRLVVLAFWLASIIPGGPARASDTVDAILKAMPLDQRVGQMFMVSFYGPALSQATEAFLREMTPGAVAMFSSNGTTPVQVTNSVNAWQSLAVQIGAKVPLIVAIDHEGGPVTRLTEGFTALPWGAALGAMPAGDARQVGQLAAEELRAVGINMNLAPVTDVRLPDLPFIERRAFGADPETVGQAATAYLQGLQAQGVIGAVKHFPGHGPAGDSHEFLPVITLDRRHIEAKELPPFKEAIQGGADVVMLGHLYYSALDSTPNRPASLSPVVINDLLRKRLGFQGLTMTDSMDMGAIVNNYRRTDAAVMAAKAGIDLIVAGPYTPMTEQAAMKRAVIDAVNQGEIPASRIEEAARRVLELKAKYGLLTWQALDAAGAAERIQVAAHQEMVDVIYLSTVAIAQDKYKRLPLKPGTKRVALVFPGVYPVIQRECGAIDRSAAAFAYSLTPTGSEIEAVRALGRSSDAVIVFTYNLLEYPSQASLVNAIPAEKAIVVAAQNPYDIERGIQPGAYLTAFNSYPGALRAACMVLYGQVPAAGSWRVIN